MRTAMRDQLRTEITIFIFHYQTIELQMSLAETILPQIEKSILAVRAQSNNVNHFASERIKSPL